MNFFNNILSVDKITDILTRVNTHIKIKYNSSLEYVFTDLRGMSADTISFKQRNTNIPCTFNYAEIMGEQGTKCQTHNCKNQVCDAKSMSAKNLFCILCYEFIVLGVDTNCQVVTNLFAILSNQRIKS